MNKRNIIISSSILFVCATMWQQTIHELGHFVAAILLHSEKVTLYHNYVLHDMSALDSRSRIFIAAAGPLLSLFLGLFLHLVLQCYKKRNLYFLFLLYITAFAYINFGGYLLISPIFVGGDTGFIFHELDFPLWLILAFVGLGVAFLFFTMKRLAPFFVEMAHPEISNVLSLRRAFIDSLVKYPLYIGVALTVLLNLPVVVFLSLLYPLFSPFTLFWSYGYMLEGSYPSTNKIERFSFSKIPLWVWLFLLFTIIVNRYLVGGLHW